MPYIPQERREAARLAPETEGELNYAITMLVVDYIRRRPAGLRYATINEALGAMDGAAREFYRRVAGPYEDGAIAKNGDVYGELAR